MPSAIDTEGPKFWRCAVTFASLPKGGHLQIHSLRVGDDADSAVDTGIIIGAVKENRHAEWKQEISFRDRTYPTVQEAIEAWKEANKCPPTAKAN